MLFYYQLVLLSFSSLFKQCVLIYLTCLIHQSGFGIPFGTFESICVPAYKLVWNYLQRNVKEGNSIHELLNGYLIVSQCDRAIVLHFLKHYFELSLMVFKSSLQQEKNLKIKHTHTHFCLTVRRGKNHLVVITKISMYGYEHLSIPLLQERFTPSEGEAGNPEPSSSWRVKVPSNALTSTEASLNVLASFW